MSAAIPARNLQLDGLRGYAAVVVAVFHTILGVDPTQIDRILRVKIHNLDGAYDIVSKLVLTVFNGETAVLVFFILSGAVLFDSLKRDRGDAWTGAASFTIRRFLRIYPTLFVCLVACLIAYQLAGIVVPPGALSSNALLFAFPLNGATWTLQVELLAVPLILVTFHAYRRFGVAGLLVAGIGILLILKLPVIREGLFYLRYGWLCFLLGMLIPTQLGARVVQMLPRHAWTVLFLGAVFLPAKLQPYFAALLVGVLYYGGAGALGRFLERPTSQFFGHISYSFYLFNVLFLEVICHGLRQMPWAAAHPLEAGLAASIPVIALTIPVAYVSLRLLENPSIDLGRTLTSFRRVRASEPSGSVTDGT